MKRLILFGNSANTGCALLYALRGEVKSVDGANCSIYSCQNCLRVAEG